ncbi:MaoC/PaaZ C-terminal domain-containing protein [Pseudonocardia acaciae]|uniref:MaoC/PaaZ C-terminal domain-containing protein n=1 Tax=Pseudonocardia acaciae TaxID=551276 RepID=UPI00048BAB74|nr:MaoC/PaaZ C-terminal domain-containing protein [Pseudonocardia acaciae]
MTEYTEGTELPALEVRLSRTDLVRYAGASGDFNPIHWSDRVAGGVGLPGVVAHGMLTMALGGRLVTDWVGDPGAVLSYQVRFTRPIPVPDVVDGVDDTADDTADDGRALVELSGKLVSVAVDGEGRTGKVNIVARAGGQSVLGRATAVVRLPN